MLNRTLARTLLLGLVCVVGPAYGQSIPGLMKGGAPDISSISPGNAAGLLSFCVKNKYLPSSSAAPVMNGLLKKPGAKSSSAYTAGQRGDIINGKTAAVPMTAIPHEYQSRACNALLKKGKALL